ncbi:hypothetical protein CPC16_002888 [Podila verticillata]|nr:hypothetical protein CPC16_002888 [Podila verticillata]
MADTVGMYVGISLGSTALFGVCVGILYRKHQQDLKELRQQEQVIRDRFQHVAENNLPPFYIDHELDPVAIYEHELPPDVVPVSEPIFVQSTIEDIIPPEEDPLVSSPPFIRGLSTPRTPSLSPSDSNISTRSLQEASLVSAPRQDSLSEPIESLTPTSELPSPISVPPTSPESALLSSVRLSPIPPITHEELMTLAQLPPPPSYDVPNRIVDQSPMMELSGFNFGSPMSLSSTTFPERTFTPSTLSNDYFTHRVRSHTFSHPSSAHHRPHESQVQVQRDETLPQTPRYSLEFPSHIPHELHLQQYQQARASSFMVSSPSSSSSTAFSTPRLDSQSPHVLHSRSFSQPEYYPTFAVSSDSLESGRRARQSPAGPRGRSSTLGESSKLLIQRMQSLWRKTGASSAMPSSAALPMFNDVPQGLGLSLGNGSSTASSSRQQQVEDVVVVVVPQDEEEEEEEEVLVASSSASTLLPENEDEEEDKESTTSEEDVPGASSSTNRSSLSLESRMPVPMAMAIPLAVS